MVNNSTIINPTNNNFSP